MEDKTLATELIAELKAHSRRWFAIAIIEAIIIFVIVIMLVNTPVADVYTQEADANDNGSISQSIGE